jgi:putative ABC transport system permease protein
MRIRYILRSALLSLRINLRYTLINIAGLATGLTVFILITIFVHSQYSFNTHIPHADELFRLERGFHGITNAVEAEPLSSGIPEIKNHCRITKIWGSIFYRSDNMSPSIRAEIEAVVADPSFIDLFGIEISERSAERLLMSPESVVLSKDLAERLFGDSQAVGQLVSMENMHDLVVEAVFENLPPSSSLEFNAILPLEYLVRTSGNPQYLENTGQWGYETFFRLSPENREITTDKLQDELEILYGDSGMTPREATLRPFKEIYFSEISDFHRHGDKKNTFIFIIVAGFVLLIAAINFINLSTAQSAKRSKETGLKKILGAERSGLIMQICTEGVITVLASILIALAVTELLIPWYSDFVSIDMSIKYSATNMIIIIFGVPLLLGALSGLFPAFYLSRVSPVSVLKKEMNTGKGGAKLRSFLTIFQFSISIFLIIGTVIVNKQLRYISSYDPGYETADIIEVTLNNQISEGFDVFKQACLSNPTIKGVTRTNQRPYQAGNVWSVYHGEKNFTWPFIQVDEDFARVFGLDIKTGEDFSVNMLQRETSLFLVNEAVIGAFETPDILSEKINNHEIVGVVNNFHTASLKSEIRPVTILLSPTAAAAYTYIKTDHVNPSGSLDAIKKIWDELSPDYPFEYEYLEDKIMAAYIEEKQFGELFTYFSMISILISCLGLFALASFTTQNRVKEICIRKVHGATSFGISLLLSGGLTRKVIVANLVAWPAAWFFMNNWLENFVYRTEPGLGEFLLAAIIAQVIALVTVSWHVYTTSLKNPAETLKHE